jgi:hypothetical protein
MLEPPLFKLLGREVRQMQHEISGLRRWLIRIERPEDQGLMQGAQAMRQIGDRVVLFWAVVSAKSGGVGT